MASQRKDFCVNVRALLKGIIATAIVLGTGEAAAQGISVSPNTERAIRKPSGDLMIEHAITARRQKVASALTASSRTGLDSIVASISSMPFTKGRAVDPGAVAQERVKTRFAGASAEQADLMTFYVLEGVAARLETSASAKGAIGDETTIESMRLQQKMERRSKLLETLSNMMQKMSATSEGIVSNLK